MKSVVVLRRGLWGASSLALAAALSLSAGAASAQQVERPQPLAESDTAANQAEVEEVVVTGSLIRGTPEDAALPVDVIGADELERQGSPTLVDLIKSLPVSNGVLGDTNQFDARAQGSEGSGSVNLRGLGSNRTLVLLNGRRLAINPHAAGGAGIVDTNIIPSAAIGRVEVLKDGAAATYGSDAIAGVVNFITRDNFDGAEIGGDYRFVDGSEGGDYSLSAIYGWKGDNAEVFLSAGYQHRSQLKVIERDFTQSSYLQNPEGGYTAAGNPGTFLSFTAPSAAGTQLFRDASCATLGGTPGFSGATPVCYEQYVDFDNLVEEEDRYQLFGSINVDLAEGHAFHAEALFSSTSVPEWHTSPSYAILSSPSPEALAGAPNILGGAVPPSALYAGRFFVPPTNPGLQAYVAQNPAQANLLAFGAAYLAPAARPLLLGGNPLFDADGASIGERKYEAYRVSAGFNGDLGFGLPGASNLNYDVALTYSQENAYTSGYDTLTNRFALALRGLGGPRCDTQPGTPGVQGPGGGAPTPGANGCLYFNPFGNAIAQNAISGETNPQFNAGLANSNEVIGWFFVQRSTEAVSRLFVADAVVSGETGITLPGGPLQFAAGVQYRRDIFTTTNSAISDSEINPCVSSPDFFNDVCSGAQRNGPFVFLGASQADDLAGDVYAAFAEAQVPVTDDFNIQLAARFEDYGGLVGSTFDPKISARYQITDMFAIRGSAGSTFRGPPTTQLAEGNITSLQSILGTFRAVDIGGNPNLEPETAKTYNLGFIVDAGSLKASLDYYRFDFDNPITAEGVGGIVNAVFPNGAAGANNCSNAALAPLVNRFVFTGGVCAPGNIARLRTLYVNGAPVKTSGLDLIAEYDFGDIYGGELSVGVNGTYVLEYNVDPSTVEGIVTSPAFEAVGFLNYQTTAVPIPEMKGQIYAEYERGEQNLRLTLNYIDGYTDQRIAPFADNAFRDSAGNFVTNKNGKEIDEFITVDATYRAFLPGDVTLTATVDNIFDEDPPFARLDLSYDPFTANPLGRTFKLGLRKAF